MALYNEKVNNTIEEVQGEDKILAQIINMANWYSMYNRDALLDLQKASIQPFVHAYMYSKVVDTLEGLSILGYNSVLVAADIYLYTIQSIEKSEKSLEIEFTGRTRVLNGTLSVDPDIKWNELVSLFKGLL